MINTAILRINTTHLLRLYFPNKIVRYGLILFAGLLLVGGAVLGIIFGLHPHPNWKGGLRSQEFVNNLSGLLAMINNSILIVPTFLTIRGALKLLENPSTSLLMHLSPTPPSSIFFALIGPLIFFAAIPLCITTGPFVIMFLVQDPLISFCLFAYFIILSCWLVTFCLGSLVILVRLLGKEKGMRVAYAAPFILLALPLIFTFGAEDFRKTAPLVGYWQLIFFTISIIVLPPLFKIVSGEFFKLVNSQFQEVKTHGEPSWGRYNPWTYILRHAVIYVLLPLFIFAVLMLTKVLKFDPVNESVYAVCLFLLSTLPVSVIMMEEKNRPDRWKLAPFSRKLKSAIWLKLNLPILTFCMLFIFRMGGTFHFAWVIAIMLVTILGVAVLSSHRLLKYPRLQDLLYLCTLMGVFLMQKLW